MRVTSVDALVAWGCRWIWRWGECWVRKSCWFLLFRITAQLQLLHEQFSDDFKNYILFYVAQNKSISNQSFGPPSRYLLCNVGKKRKLMSSWTTQSCWELWNACLAVKNNGMNERFQLLQQKSHEDLFTTTHFLHSIRKLKQIWILPP